MFYCCRLSFDNICWLKCTSDLHSTFQKEKKRRRHFRSWTFYPVDVIQLDCIKQTSSFYIFSVPISGGRKKESRWQCESCAYVCQTQVDKNLHLNCNQMTVVYAIVERQANSLVSWVYDEILLEKRKEKSF